MVESNFEELDMCDFGRIKDVKFYSHIDLPNEINKIVIIFDLHIVIFSVNVDYDSINIQYLKKSENKIEAKIDIDSELSCINYNSIDEVLKLFLTRNILWCWLLTNQQGYEDGVQFELIDRMKGYSHNTKIQFVTKGSSIQIQKIEKPIKL